MTLTSARALRGYISGRWTIDPVHSEIGFSVRHAMVSKVRGRFTKFSGQIVTAEGPMDSSAEASIETSSVATGNSDRDNHLRSPDFFDVATYPTMSYRSIALRRDGDNYTLDGALTIKAVTKPISLHLEVGGFGVDTNGDARAGFTAIGTLNRRDFGVNFNALLETGGVVVADRVDLHLEIEAVLTERISSRSAVDATSP